MCHLLLSLFCFMLSFVLIKSNIVKEHTRWIGKKISPEQALQYAPDDSSVKAAKKLAAINHWQSLQQHATADGKTLDLSNTRK